ncbi:ABC transporter substrate-binding protein [Shouchella shacheensis]|uniref:ABC transporter substrate-binding protein n=1 Tax=Shouchella shacheensis TaxID=1649580 RepID=UPI00073FE885|nr:ABC transporter substrate-binding protein [Shouchella shacheensis]
MYKKLVGCGLASVSLATLVACGGSEDTSQQEGSDEVVNLQWYMIGTPQPDLDKVMAELNEYTEEEIGVNINMTQVDWGDYEERMQIITSSGENYDIAFAAGDTYTLNAQRGAYADITDMLDEEGSELKEVLDPALVEGASIDGRLYGVPANKEVGQQWVFVFNGNLVEKYDLDTENVESLEDLEPLLETVHENEPNVTPLTPIKPILPFDYVIGDETPVAFPFTGDTDTVVNFLETDEAMETYKTMREYYQAGYIPSDAASSNDPYPLNVENWFVRLEQYNPYAELNWEREAGYPVEVQPLHDPVINNDSVTGSLQVISSTSEHPEKAMEFLNLLNTDEYVRNLVNYGIEGEHFERLDDGTIEDQPARVERYSMPTYALGNHFILDLFENEPADKWEAFEEFNESAEPGPILGFHFDPTPVRTEIANISNVSSEFMPAIYTGSVDPEEYLPLATERFEAAGLQTVIDEAQRQYDEWVEEVKE